MLVVGACAGRSVSDDSPRGAAVGGSGAALAGGGTGGAAASAGSKSALPAGGAGAGALPVQGGDGGGSPEPDSTCEGGVPGRSSNCEDYQDVVCSWQRVTVREGAGDGGAGSCDLAEQLIDPTGAPQGGAGGDWPGRNACTGYDLVPEEIEQCFQGCCRTYQNPTIERRLGTCTVAGHCCVVLDVQHCGP
jgi:hypothetical protein